MTNEVWRSQKFGGLETHDKMKIQLWLLLASIILSCTNGFAPLVNTQSQATTVVGAFPNHNWESSGKIDTDRNTDSDDQCSSGEVSRRSVLTSSSMVVVGAASSLFVQPEQGQLFAASPARSANAAVGTLPEFADTNAIIQGITVNVADKSQQDSMINFLTGAFDFQVLRKRISGSVEDTVRG